VKNLVFPVVDAPDVSIVVVTFGAEKWVRRCLRAILDRTEPCYEVIVVDNASPDGFAARLAESVEKVRIVTNPVNRGFGPACNQGANVARGALLVFLNSDALVEEGWLPALRAALEADPRAAAVAPQLRNLDGTVQEAGALLFSNGFTQFYGMGDDPGRPEYRFPRDVDYASAACLAVWRRQFVEVGGFDAIYAPAYYEDVDLCLTLREKGYRVLYEPRAVVTHARGASSSATLPVRLWRRNHPKFFARWERRLASQPEYTPAEDGNPRLRTAARDAAAATRILLVAGEDRDAAREAALVLERLYPDSRRTIGATVGKELDFARAEQGWEALEIRALQGREFHYDAVVFCDAPGFEASAELLDQTQPQAVRIRYEGAEKLEASLAFAGIPAAAPAR
jgi:GT2 family glycosyltransferase